MFGVPSLATETPQLREPERVHSKEDDVWPIPHGLGRSLTGRYQRQHYAGHREGGNVDRRRPTPRHDSAGEHSPKRGNDNGGRKPDRKKRQAPSNGDRT